MDKVVCDACGKEVGAASAWHRVGFRPGATLTKVCGSCYTGKLTRDQRLLFTKKAARKAAADEAEDEPEEEPGPRDELRSLG